VRFQVAAGVAAIAAERSGAVRVAERFFAPLLRSTDGMSGFGGSVASSALFFPERGKREKEGGRERKRERGLSCGAVLIYQGIKKKTIYKVGLYRGKQY